MSDATRVPPCVGKSGCVCVCLCLDEGRTWSSASSSSFHFVPPRKCSLSLSRARAHLLVISHRALPLPRTHARWLNGSLEVTFEQGIKRSGKMSMTQNIMRRIFGDRKLPDGLSNEEYDKYMQDNFPKWVKEFEDGGFLEKTKLPAIKSEDELLEKLVEHKNDMLVIKFWKHGCLPCLTFAEMYKEASERYKNSGKRVFWYSCDTKALSTRQLVDLQLVAGTPTVQTFTGYKQVGNEIRATNIDDLMHEIDSRLPSSAVAANAPVDM